MTMEPLRIAPTGRSPEVDFDFEAGVLRLKGESYPDDVAAFFGPVLGALRSYLAEPSDRPIRFDMELIYFNSSSAKALMNVFQMLEGAAKQGRPVAVNWYHERDDEAMQELGEDFSLDLNHVEFNLKETPSGDDR